MQRQHRVSYIHDAAILCGSEAAPWLPNLHLELGYAINQR